MLTTSTVNEISLIQKEVYNRAIIHLCVSTVTSGTGAPTGVAVGQMSFARVDGTAMKQILKDIQSNYGGCITKKAKSHRRGILILSKLRTAVSGIDMQRVDVKAKWSEVAQIVQEVLQEEQDIKVAMRSGKSTSDNDNSSSGIIGSIRSTIHLRGEATAIHSNGDYGIFAANSGKVIIHLPSHHNTSYNNGNG